jgi:hypothetical protein
MQMESLAHQLGAEGCSRAEIAEIEEDQGVRLPAMYRQFLAVMGRDTGGLAGSTAMGYPGVLGLRDVALDLYGSPAGGSLPGDAIVIGLDSRRFWFVRATDGADPAVWLYCDGPGGTPQPEIVATSMVEMLEWAVRKGQLPGL